MVRVHSGLPFQSPLHFLPSSGFAHSLCRCAASSPLDQKCSYSTGMKTAVSIPETSSKGPSAWLAKPKGPAVAFLATL
jgi:hypothetical protein